MLINNILKQYYDLSNFPNYNKYYTIRKDRMNLWKNQIQVNHRTKEFLYALAKLQTATPESALFNLPKITLYEEYHSSIIYLFNLTFKSSPDIANATLEELQVIQSNIFVLLKFVAKFINNTFKNFGYALMKYTNNIMISFLKRYFKILGCKYEFGTEDFKFYFAHCRKYLKSSLLSKEGYWIYDVLSKEDIKAFKFYSKCIKQWYLKMKEISSFIDLKVSILWFFDKDYLHHWSGEYFSRYTFSQALEKSEGSELIQKLLECPLISPFFDYNIVANNYARKVPRRINSIYLTAEWKNFPGSLAIVKNSSVFNSKWLTMLLRRHYKNNSKEVEEIIKLALDKLQSYCKDPNKVKVLKGIYEYEFANVCREMGGEDLEKLLSAKISNSISNPMIYGLFDAGLDSQIKIRDYFLVELMQKASPEFCHNIVENYLLPLNVVSFQMYVEPRDYKFKKGCYERRLCRVRPKGVHTVNNRRRRKLL